MKTFKEFSKENLPKINACVEQILTKKEQETAAIDTPLRASMQELNTFTANSGKRVRSLLTLLCAEYLGKKIGEDEMHVAASCELIHAFFLVHDDIMDNSDKRRGKPTVHKTIEQRFAQEKNKESIGMDLAMISGDMLACIANQTLMYTQLSNEIKVKLSILFNEIILNTCYGQIIDYETNFRKEKQSKDALKICTLKTAKYTIEGPLHIGATLAGASKEVLKELSAFAIPLGIAFQIHDDFLDLYGDEEKTGKPLYGDLREEKGTLILTKAMEFNPQAQELALIGKEDLSKEEGKRIADFFISCGAKEYCAKEIIRLHEESLKALENSSLPEEFKEVLKEFATVLITREK